MTQPQPQLPVARTLAQIAAARTDLGAEQVAHCEALVKDLGLLADLAFADLVLWLPVWNQGGYVAAAQVRPTTAATRLPGDLVGTFVPRGRRPELDRASTPAGAGALIPRVDPAVPAGEEAVAVAMSHNSPAIAVLSRTSSPTLRAGGSLERAYLQAADELLAMIRVGAFPLPEGGIGGLTGAEARVGDGLIRLDQAGRVLFASPNASSAFRRLGVAADLAGTQLALVAGRVAARAGTVDASLAMVAGGRVPGQTELATATANVTLRAIPLVADRRSNGALLLVRDVTELRRRERALLSKDATIREIHHRVKNNLQTVAALLRMQGRRLADPGAVAALAEAERRVSAIAVVHDLLAHEVSQDVEFDAIADRLLALVSQTATPGGAERSIRRTGSFGQVPAGSATALSMALVELLANALEHGAGEVVLAAQRQVSEAPGRVPGPGTLLVTVSDAGAGIPSDFDLSSSPRLGLRIVWTLVHDEMRGSLSWRRTPNPDGDPLTMVEIEVPL